MPEQPRGEWIIEHTLRVYRGAPKLHPAAAVDCWAHDCPACAETVLLWREWTGHLRIQHHNPQCPYGAEPAQLARAWGIR